MVIRRGKAQQATIADILPGKGRDDTRVQQSWLISKKYVYKCNFYAVDSDRIHLHLSVSYYGDESVPGLYI